MATKKIGGSIVLEGASKYNQDLKNIKSSLSLLKSEMKLANTQYAETANTTEALSKKHQIYEKEIEQVTKKVKTYSAMLKEQQDKQKDAASDIDKYTKELEDAEKALREMEKSGKASNEELETQKRVIKDAGDNLKRANDQYDSASKKIDQYTKAENLAEAELIQLNRELKNNDKYLDEAEKSADGCAKSIDEYGKEVGDAGKETSRFGDIVKGSLTVDAIEAGLKTLCNGIKKVAEASIDAGMSFEASMSKVEAISGATGDDLEALREKAKEMGATTMFSATQSADALQYMAMAGWKAQDMIAGLPAVMNLAAASGEDLATVSDIVTDDLTAFGLSANDAAHFADVLAAASSNSNTNVTMMGESFKYAGAIAGAMGYTIEDMSVSIGLMANAGIKASQAGTSLRSVITRLAKPTKESQMAIDALGIEITDSEGNMLTWMDVMKQLRGSFDGLTEAEKAQYAAMLAGKTGMSGLLSIINASEEDFNKLVDSINNSTGAAQNMADTMQNNLKGKVTILQSALEGLGISVYDVFSEDLKYGVTEATRAVERLHDSVENGDIGVSLNKMSDALGDLIANSAELAEDVLPVVIDMFTWVIDNAGVITGALAGMLAGKIVFEAIQAWTTFKKTIEGVTIAQWALNAAESANPLGLVITAVGIATGALAGFALQMSNATTEGERLMESLESSQESLNKQTSTYDAQRGRAAELCETIKALNSIEGELSKEQKDELAVSVAELAKLYPDLSFAIDETTGKLEGSTDAINKQIDAIKASVDVQTIQKEMDLLINQIAEDELKLAEAHKAAEEAGEWEYMKHKNGLMEVNEARFAAVEAIEACEEAIEGEKARYAECSEELDRLTQAQEEAAEAAVESTEKGEDAIDGFTEAMENDLKEIIKKVDEFSGMFDQISTEAEASLADMSENLKHNAGAMDDYADNIHRAMKLAADSTDENVKDIVDYLIGLGLDGSAELAQFVEAAQSNSKEFNDILQNFGDYEQAQWNAEQALNDWRMGFNEGWDLIIEDTRTKGDEQAKEQQATYDAMTEQAEKYKEDSTQMATDTQQAIADATLGEQGTVEDAYQAVAQAAVDQTTTTWGINDGNSSVFYDLGTSVGRSIADGIRSGSSEVCDAVHDLCDDAVSSFDLSGLVSRIDSEIASAAARQGVASGGF